MTVIDDRAALQDLMLRYGASVDDRDLVQYRACFADDVGVVGFSEHEIIGADIWVENVESQLQAFEQTQHLLGLPLLNIEGDRAAARTDVQALHTFRERPGARLTLWATYKTEFQRISGDWKIIRHELIVRTMAEENA